MKIAKPVIKISTEVLVFYIGGCLLLLVVVFGSFFLMTFGKYSHVAPNEIVKCEAYEQFIPPGGLPGTPGSEEGPVACESGDTLDDLMRKNIEALASRRDLSYVGLVLVDCPGHEACDLIGESAWCYASGIYCKRDKIEGAMASNCDYVSNLLCHELVHHIQASQATGETREWGADYVCANGGGYTFRDSTGTCDVATAITLPSSCSGQVAVEAAYHNMSYPGVTRCIEDLKNKSNLSFCR